MTGPEVFQLSETQAWQVVSAYAGEIASLKMEGLSAIAVIGSLPGGYYRPGQSDLDLVLLFKQFPEHYDLNAQIERALRQTAEKMALNLSLVDLEAFPRLEADILPNPETGKIPRPDLAARLQTQAKVLWGNLPLAGMRMPTSSEWVAQMAQFLAYWHSNHPENAEVTPRAAAGFALSLMRLFLAARHGLVEYDKRRLLELFTANAPEVPLPPIFPKVISRTLAGQPPSREQFAAFLSVLPEFQAEIETHLA